MGITKGQIQDLIREVKGGGDAPENSKFHPQIIAVTADVIRNSIIQEELNVSRKNKKWSINSQFFTKVDLTIKQDKYKRDVAELPVQIVALNGDRGLRSVAPTGEISKTFNIIENGADAVFSHLESGTMGTDVYLEDDFLVIVNKPRGMDKITATVIQTIVDLEDDEAVPMPPGYEKRFIDEIIAFLEEEKITTHDKYNDSNSNQNDV